MSNIPTEHTSGILDLSGNKLGDKGAKWVSQVINSGAHLKEIQLGCNSIGDEGAKDIADAIARNNTSLTYLNLWGNEIKIGGAIAITDALRWNSTLTKLDLSRNYIGREGIRQLIGKLEENHTLTHLDLCYQYPHLP
jgi:Ran GTPase-activating protein (RanGAP) involved in mRNA processing and transport